MRVGVIGAGCAGLACAADLARAGVDVTVYEVCGTLDGRCAAAPAPPPSCSPSASA